MNRSGGIYLRLLLCMLLVLSFAGHAQAGAEISEGLLAEFEERRRATAEVMEAATVWIVAEDSQSIFSGSGFIVADGYIMTNAHVIDNLKKDAVVYVLNHLIPPTKAAIVAQVHENNDGDSVTGRDFALLRFTPPKGAALPILPFRFDVKRMDRVSAWGYPSMVTRFDESTFSLRKGDTKGLRPAPVVYTEGTVSSVVRDRYGEAIIHTAAIAGGNSGGPLVNSRGEVVGINTWGYTEEDEGAFLNGSLPAVEVVAFLQNNGVAPRIVEGQSALAAQTAGARRPPATEEVLKIPDVAKPDRQPTRDRTKDVGDFTVRVPEGWSVTDEERNYILLESDDEEAAFGIIMASNDGMSLKRVAGEYADEFDNVSDVELDDGIYTFTAEEDGVDVYFFLADIGNDEHFLFFLAGDENSDGVDEIFDSIESKREQTGKNARPSDGARLDSQQSNSEGVVQGVIE